MIMFLLLMVKMDINYQPTQVHTHIAFSGVCFLELNVLVSILRMFNLYIFLKTYLLKHLAGTD